MKTTTQLFGAGMIAGVALVAYGCSDGPAETVPEDRPGEGVELPDGTIFTRRALLEAVGTCVLSNARTFEERAAALDAAAAAAATDPTKLEDARQAWRDAIDVWQRLEVMQIGPAASSTQPGGVDLRDSVYAWPLTSPCVIDGHLVSETYASSQTDDVLINGRGLGAAEYLLFHDGEGNACAADHELNTNGSWAALDASTRTARRAAYSAFVAKDIATWSSALVRAWDPQDGDFLGELAKAGDTSKTFTRDRIALNASSDALFYIEWATKDLKVGRPAGITQCASATCPDAVESPFAKRSKVHVRNNLVGLRMLFTGCGEDGAGLGFDDFLYSVGQEALGQEIDGSIVSAIAAVDAIEEEDLPEAIVTDSASVSSVHQSLKRISDLFRTDFVTILDLELPKRVEGDND